MKEDLSLYGYVAIICVNSSMCSNELNFFTTYFNIGYAIFLIPSQYFITWFPPSLYLPTLEVSPASEVAG